MISIIICSVNPVLLGQLTLNIGDTIGIPFEIIAIDNREGQDGICKVYNKAGGKAKYEILCFVHEDILFRTRDWGRLLLAHFHDQSAGLIGVAGGDSMGTVPSTWSSSFRSAEVNLMQHYKDGEVNCRHLYFTGEPEWKINKKVKVLDGVFLCTTKAVFDRFKFDEINFPGFHGYDIDYSLQVSVNYDILVVFDIMISHFSEGTPDRKWLDSTLTLHKKWRHHLPVSVYPLTKAEFRFYHWKLLQVFVEHLFRLQYTNRQILAYYLRFAFGRYFAYRRFLSMGKYVSMMMVQRKKLNKSQT